MKVDTVLNTGSSGASQLSRSQPASEIESQRKERDRGAEHSDFSVKTPKMQPEELLDKIKEITSDGSYSVRFQQFKDTEELIVQIYDNNTDEVIRELPPEELLEMKVTMSEFREGLVINEQA
ncbi:MAG: flagellar biosynthesis protein FlaG [Deltaproteobacteria bacterium]|nr:MAG: flagellar biosynthesis protein FlaG [Deltaproteobacteria bacterium]